MENMEIGEAKNNNDYWRLAKLAAEIWNECYAGLISQGQIDYMLARFQSAQAIQRQCEEEGYRYYLATLGAEDAAYLGLQAKAGRLLLSKCYLLAKWRGQGYADQLFGAVEELARELLCPTIWLTVNRGNKRAIAAYEKRGYRTVREQVVDIGGGYVMDDYVMEKQCPM